MAFRGLRVSDFIHSQELAAKDSLVNSPAGKKFVKDVYKRQVSEQLMERLNLLEKSGNGYYRLIHDNFMDYLVKAAGENRHRLGQYRKKVLGLRLTVGILAAALLAGGAAAVYRSVRPRELTEAEKYGIRNAAQRLMINLQLLDTQMVLQRGVLREAGGEGVLDGNTQMCIRDSHIASRVFLQIGVLLPVLKYRGRNMARRGNSSGSSSLRSTGLRPRLFSFALPEHTSTPRQSFSRPGCGKCLLRQWSCCLI